MPNPIPDWDLARRLTLYIGMRQVSEQPVTVREATVTLGVGRERLESVMQEKNIIYHIFSGTEASGKDIIALQYVPASLALDAGLSNSELDTSYRKLVELEMLGQLRIVAQKRQRLTKKQREHKRVTEFWQRQTEKTS